MYYVVSVSNSQIDKPSMGNEAILHKEGGCLMVEPVRKGRLTNPFNLNQLPEPLKILDVVCQQIGDIISQHGGHDIGIMNLLTPILKSLISLMSCPVTEAVSSAT